MNRPAVANRKITGTRQRIGPATLKADYEPVYGREIRVDQELDPIIWTSDRITGYKLREKEVIQ